MRFMEIYHHQKSFFQQQQRWAGSLIELGIDPLRHAAFQKPLQIRSNCWRVSRDCSKFRSRTARCGLGTFGRTRVCAFKLG